MEKEEVKVEQEEEEEVTPKVRESRSGFESKSTEELAALGIEVSNGHVIQSRVAENGAENEESNSGNEQKKVKLEGVLGNDSEAINKKKKSDNLVFYDKDEGIWKCRICFWTYQTGNVCVDYIQDHKGHIHKLMNVETLNFEARGVTYSGEKQIEKKPGHDKLDSPSHQFDVRNSSTYMINNIHEGDLEDDDLSSSNLQPPQISLQEHSLSYQSSKEIESADVELVNGDDDLEVKEFDVERVLQKQTTHDLYCPNCNSCITRRVILRKRKRRIRVSDQEVKRNKTETTVDSELATGLVLASIDVDQVHQTDDVDDACRPTADDDERDRGPDIFRCLSCFSFFIPTGIGFKLFQTSGEKSRKDNVQDLRVSSVKRNWFTSIFASNKMESAVEQDEQGGEVGDMPSPSSPGDQSVQPPSIQKVHKPQAPEELIGATGNIVTLEGGDKILSFPTQEPASDGEVLTGAGYELDETTTEKIDDKTEALEAYTTDQLKGSESSKEVQVDHESDLSTETHPKRTQVTDGASAEDTISYSQQGGLKLLISSNKVSLVLENSEESQMPMQTMELGASENDTSPDEEPIQLLPSSLSELRASNVDGKFNSSIAIPHEEQHTGATILTESVVVNTNANFITSARGQVHPSEVSQHIISKAKLEVHTKESLKVDSIPSVNGVSDTQSKDSVITIAARLPQTAQGVILPAETSSGLPLATQISTVDSERTETSRELEVEVIKSMVYGGLAESITSLSIVSSAAGGNAATLNILALGIANLIGGLIILCHNLWELRHDRTEQMSHQVSHQATKQGDRYKQLLGQRENFILHAIVSILSYLIFGLVPPLVYGLSFRKSNDKELKLLVVAAASLVCIMVLAVGRAYVQRPPKPYSKSVVTFLALGFMVSGVSYGAGVLVERLLEKLGLFQSKSLANLLMGARPTNSPWVSY